MAEEASAKSGCLYAVNRNGRIVSERGGAVIVPWSLTKTVIAAATSALVRDGALHTPPKLAGYDDAITARVMRQPDMTLDELRA
jgi:hypothetical protein